MSAVNIDRAAARGEGGVLLLGRVLVAALFLPAGWSHLTGISGFAQYLASAGVPGPAIVWAVVAAVVEFFGSLALLVGFRTRYAALALGAFTVVAAVLGHPYWAADAASMRGQQIHFYKDIAIVGGLLFVFARGAGPLSIDRR
jgi:putative oxidoreductase